MPRLTPQTTLVNRMKRLQVLSAVEDTYLVRDIDEAIRQLRMDTQLPWTITKGVLRVFDGVLEYPVMSDHDELAYLDASGKHFGQTARFVYKSLQAFYEDGDNRNDLAQIQEGGDTYLGVRYRGTGIDNQLVTTSDSITNVTLSGVAVSPPVVDSVVFEDGNSTLRFSVVTPGTASYTKTFTAFADQNYQRKYYFKKVYFSAVPTSVTLRFGTDASNYFYSTVTTQFSGQSFRANQFNVLAFDLNTASEFGTVDPDSFGIEGVDINGAPAGTYYIDNSYLRGWVNLAFWYYSRNTVATDGSSIADVPFFYDTATDVMYEGASLVGDEEFVNLIQYMAQDLALMDKEDSITKASNAENLKNAKAAFDREYPSEKPIPVYYRWRFSWQENLPAYYDTSLLS